MNNISVGDLVVVVRPDICCNNVESIGKIFTVQDISPGENNESFCIYCGKQSSNLLAWDSTDFNTCLGYDLDILQRIKPQKSEISDSELMKKMERKNESLFSISKISL
jgi:hypothetical protein